MPEDPLDAVYSYVERAYIRLQAGDLLVRCIDEDSTGPIQQVVEGFILAGPQSLDALREILAEAEQRKSQLVDDINQVLFELDENLRSYGIQIDEAKMARKLSGLSATHFLALLRAQGVLEEATQITCLQLLRDSKELMSTLNSHLNLMTEVVTYLQDWMWGLAYQSVRQARENRTLPHLLIKPL